MNIHRSGSEEKKYEVTTTATELRQVHRECLIATDNGYQGTGFSILIYSFNNYGVVATETRKPLPHTFTAHEDRGFKARELVLLTSVAIARFKNKIGANFWIFSKFLDFLITLCLCVYHDLYGLQSNEIMGRKWTQNLSYLH